MTRVGRRSPVHDVPAVATAQRGEEAMSEYFGLGPWGDEQATRPRAPVDPRRRRSPTRRPTPSCGLGAPATRSGPGDRPLRPRAPPNWRTRSRTGPSTSPRLGGTRLLAGASPPSSLACRLARDRSATSSASPPRATSATPRPTASLPNGSPAVPGIPLSLPGIRQRRRGGESTSSHRPDGRGTSERRLVDVNVTIDGVRRPGRARASCSARVASCSPTTTWSTARPRSP